MLRVADGPNGQAVVTSGPGPVQIQKLAEGITQVSGVERAQVARELRRIQHRTVVLVIPIAPADRLGAREPGERDPLAKMVQVFLKEGRTVHLVEHGTEFNWREIVPCPTCGQVEKGQTGEYPCQTCGLPNVHDEAEKPEVTHTPVDPVTPAPKARKRKT